MRDSSATPAYQPEDVHGPAPSQGYAAEYQQTATDLVLALLDARPDPATARFDGEIEAAIASRQLDPQVARTLRWWQRQSMRGVRDDLEEILPALLPALDRAADRADTAMQIADGAWSTTTDQSSSPNRTRPPNTVEHADVNPEGQMDESLTDNVSRAGPTNLAERRRRMLVDGLVSASARAIPRPTSGDERR